MRKAQVTAVASALVIWGCAWADSPAKKFEVGPDTTRVDGPVLKDGTIDYPSATLSQLRAGLTAQNNSWPVMERALGIWKKLPPGSTDEANMALMKQLDDARGRPWKAGEFPAIAAWLGENEGALELVSEASRKGRLVMPEWVDEKTGEVTWGPGLSSMRDIVNALAARAMMEIAGGEQEKARADAATLHRLARQLITEPTMIQGLFGAAVDEAGWQVSFAGARAGTAVEARHWLADSAAVPEVRLNIAAVDISVRYQALNLVMQILRGHADVVLTELTMMNLEGMFLDSKTGATINPGDLDQADWNLVLRQINATYDQAVAVLKQEDPEKRRAGWVEFRRTIDKGEVPGNFFDALGGSMLNAADGDYETQKKKMLERMNAFLRRGQDETTNEYSERIAQYLTHGAGSIANGDDLSTRHIAKQRLVTVTMALVIYHSQKGEYPGSLDAVKEIVGQVPVDPFTGKAFIYHNDAGGCRIYSVGADGKDNGGAKGSDDVVLDLIKS